ncbi:MAG: mechanosensitive ion channel [Candidatus Poribacteria bacterium]|nr:mechanosensitive ion channel [Candidatus Poribacteria bacterium]
MTDIFEELKQAFTIGVPVPFVNGFSIDLIQVAAFAAIFGGFIVLGGFLRRYLRRLLMKLQVREDRQSRVLGGAYLISGLIGFIVALNAFGAPRELMRRLLSYSIPIGQTRLSVTSIAVAVTIVLASTLLARYVRVVMRDKVLPPFQLPVNAEFLFLRFTQLLVIAFGVLVAVNLIGFNMNSVLVALGGLSIGIGFGLQNIASNFVSGVIMVFERPIKIDDRVTVGGTYGIVKAINMRSTVVTTPEDIDIIIPNSKFISETVTNLTHDNTRTRIKVSIGVSYESDEDLVKKLLLEVANTHPETIKEMNPDLPDVVPPFVRFIQFGDSSLNFELLAWIPNVMRRLEIISELHFMIRKKFREHGIVIAFPQRDVHFYPAADVQPKEI